METTTGVIVRRSCMGKQLSFADLRCNSDEVLVKVAFRRHAWQDETSSTPDGGTDGSPPLAFTGAAFTGWLLQGAMTLVGLGVLIVVAARRRLSDDASVA